MSDTVSKVRRSEIMSTIKSSNTKPELLVRSYLHKNRFRFRINDKSLKGKPDIKLSKYKTLIFVNGCFWHGHKNCKIYVMPKTNKSFWYTKVETNIARDKKNIRALRKMGWKVLILWECQLRNSIQNDTLNKLINKINNIPI